MRMQEQNGSTACEESGDFDIADQEVSEASNRRGLGRSRGGVFAQATGLEFESWVAPREGRIWALDGKDFGGVKA